MPSGDERLGAGSGRDPLQPGSRMHGGAGDVWPLWDGEVYQMEVGERRGRGERVCKDVSELLELSALCRNLSLPLQTVTVNQVKHIC